MFGMTITRATKMQSNLQKAMCETRTFDGESQRERVVLAGGVLGELSMGSI